MEVLLIFMSVLLCYVGMLVMLSFFKYGLRGFTFFLLLLVMVGVAAQVMQGAFDLALYQQIED